MKYAVTRHETGVWTSRGNPVESASRLVAIDAMVAMGLDSGDFRKRDKIISAICERVDGMLDHAASQGGDNAMMEPEDHE